MDLVAKKGDERIAIEIETGKSEVKANIQKCKKAGFEKVVVVNTKSKRRKSVKYGSIEKFVGIWLSACQTYSIGRNGVKAKPYGCLRQP